LDGFSQLSASFSSEAGAVLTFLLTFCVKTKSKSGFGAEAPIRTKDKKPHLNNSKNKNSRK
jgi:hypothetical protein